MQRYLVLENGMTFTGQGFGADVSAVAEVVFTTAMTGCVETLTDPSYRGQAVVQTFPLIGNYGVVPEDFESAAPALSAYIVRELCPAPSNFRSAGPLNDWLKRCCVPVLAGIDTRALTRVLRGSGTMNGALTDDPAGIDLDALKSWRCVRPVADVSTKKAYELGGDGPRVTLMDYGEKKSIADALVARGCHVFVFPHNATPEDVTACRPQGLMLSNGPGDPKDNADAIATLRALIPLGIPTMGVCLGHQLYALARGFDTVKLKFGHRGANQPAVTPQGRAYITSQNHGYAVDSADLSIAEPMFVNANDGTNEGLRYLDAPAFTVQFHPEAHGGPHDTEFLFDEFMAMMNGGEL